MLTLTNFLQMEIILCCFLFAKLCPTLLWLEGLKPARLLCSWSFPGKDTGVGCHFLFEGIFLSQGPNLCLLHWQVSSLPLSHLGSPHLEKHNNSNNKTNTSLEMLTLILCLPNYYPSSLLTLLYKVMAKIKQIFSLI